MGVQSTALYYMSSIGELPRADHAIFSDTGKEKKKTIEYLDFLLSWQKDNNGIPIVIVRKKDLYSDLLNSVNSTGQRFASIPAFTKNEDGSKGMLRRQCTSEYKIYQVDQAIRDLYGMAPRKRLPKTEVWQGITMDEMDRMSIPQSSWKTHVYPFIGYQASKKDTEKIDWGIRMRRDNVVVWYKKHELPVPPKSSCTFCPYQSDAAWLSMKNNEPEDWESAILVDRAIRDSTKKGINSPAYLHDTCVPLEDVKFNENNNVLWKGECSGTCHV